VVTSVRFHRGRPIIALDGVRTMDDAESLAGAELRVLESELVPLPAGSFYRHDLVGCDVQLKNGGTVGRVRAVEGPVTGSLLVVETGRGDVLIPLADDICVAIEPERRRIVIEPPEGLLDLNWKRQ
jgi:16S rRNA processing protein RimM